MVSSFLFIKIPKHMMIFLQKIDYKFLKKLKIDWDMKK